MYSSIAVGVIALYYRVFIWGFFGNANLKFGEMVWMGELCNKLNEYLLIDGVNFDWFLMLYVSLKLLEEIFMLVRIYNICLRRMLFKLSKENNASEQETQSCMFKI